eukprot:4776539-Amphidinium_carterae.1
MMKKHLRWFTKLRLSEKEQQPSLTAENASGAAMCMCISKVITVPTGWEVFLMQHPEKTSLPTSNQFLNFSRERAFDWPVVLCVLIATYKYQFESCLLGVSFVHMDVERNLVQDILSSAPSWN